MIDSSKVFISYSHDSPAHKLWVANLANRLMQDGIYVSIDQWDLRLGDDISQFAERGILTADYVLVICSDNYVEKANQTSGGVGFEKTIITKELSTVDEKVKYVPILRNNNSGRLPDFLADRLYLDFSA